MKRFVFNNRTEEALFNNLWWTRDKWVAGWKIECLRKKRLKPEKAYHRAKHNAARFCIVKENSEAMEVDETVSVKFQTKLDRKHIHEPWFL